MGKGNALNWLSCENQRHPAALGLRLSGRAVDPLGGVWELRVVRGGVALSALKAGVNVVCSATVAAVFADVDVGYGQRGFSARGWCAWAVALA